MPNIICENIRLSGISVALPKNKVSNLDLDFISAEEKNQLIESTGILERRIASPILSSSDLCYSAAQRLMNDLHWEPKEIEILVFVSQTPSHLIPGDASLLQAKLALSKNCVVLDVNQGCSGYVYGLMLLSSMLSNMKKSKGLLLVGDTISKTLNVGDKSTVPIFSDAGSASALEYRKGSPKMFFNLQNDGQKYKAISQAKNSFLEMNGLDVFYFAANEVPKQIKTLLDESQIQIENIDYFVLHQANKLLNEHIRKKLNFNSEKVPSSLEKFGNTSCASIPVTLVKNLSEILQKGNHRILLSGFGVGLSWASLILNISDIVCSEIIEI